MPSLPVFGGSRGLQLCHIRGSNTCCWCLQASGNNMCVSSTPQSCPNVTHPLNCTIANAVACKKASQAGTMDGQQKFHQILSSARLGPPPALQPSLPGGLSRSLSMTGTSRLFTGEMTPISQTQQTVWRCSVAAAQPNWPKVIHQPISRSHTLFPLPVELIQQLMDHHAGNLAACWLRSH